ncbi:MAG: lysylphosphatidylglycerol synthase transmembrane domain-containing protein [Candidatus Omnitrophota bacterium]
MKQSGYFKTVIFVIVTIFLIAILMSQITLEDIADTLRGMDGRYILIAFLVYICGCIFKSLRIALILKSKISLGSAFTIICIHNLFNSILPARTGELSYIHLVKKRHNISLGEGMASLTLARVLDFCAVFFFFFLSAVFVKEAPRAMLLAVIIVMSLSVIMLVLLIVLVCFRERVPNLIEAFTRTMRVEKSNASMFITRKLKEVLEGLTLMNSGKRIFLGFLSSILIWGSTYLVSWVLFVKGMGLNLTFFELVMASTFVTLTTILPIQGLAGYGTSEGAWVLSVMPFGITKTEAISSGFSGHTIAVVFFVLLGVAGFILSKWKRKI